MKRMNLLIAILMTSFLASIIPARAEIVGDDRAMGGRFITPDRYLEVEIWTDNSQYYQGDEITISFRTNRDSYVAIYNIDTRGRVNLIFPTSPAENGWVQGGRTYRLPGTYDSYSLTVQGPAGTEYLQAVASREPLPIPAWYDGSGLICEEDPYDFIDYINSEFFGCDYGCPRATDMTSFTIREWHNYYFRPVYVHRYPDWSLCGSVYIDYPFGATIYIDGIYWGVAPLFIPRIYWGYHYVTIYDRWGHCWEDRIHVVRYKSVVIDETIVRTRPGVKSRYREVERSGFRDPVKHGYPEFHREAKIKESYKPVSKTGFREPVTKAALGYDSRTRGSDDYKSASKKSSGSYENHRIVTKQSPESYRNPDGNNSRKQGSARVYDGSKSRSDGASKRSGEARQYESRKSGGGAKQGSSGKVSSPAKSAPSKESSGGKGSGNSGGSSSGSKKKR